MTSVAPAFGSVIVGFALSACAFATVASSVAGFLSFSVCSAVTFSPSTSLSAGMFSTFQLPSSPTVASPILLPSLSFNTTLAPGTPVPVTSVAPAFGSVIVGFALSCADSSQTAYTVLASVIFARIPSSAAVASFVLAQPLNVYPSLVGASGAVTPSVKSSVFVDEPSANLPPFASNVTNFSSDHIAYTTWWVVTGVSAVNFLSATNLLKSADLTVVAPNSFLPSSVTQPKNVFPVAAGASGNASPVPAWTFSPANPLATYPWSSQYFTLSGTIFTDFLLASANCPSVVSNNTLVLTLVSTSSEPKDDPSEALK